MKYQDFHVIVDSNGKIRASSAQGDVKGELSLDMNSIGHTLDLIAKKQTNGELLKDLGSTLFQALFPREINKYLSATIAGAKQKGYGVRLRLMFEPPELAALPWEFLYDKERNSFLANDTACTLSRYIDVPMKKSDIKKGRLPLKVLVVISHPSDMASFDYTGEEQVIRRGLAKNIETGHVELDVLCTATIRKVTQILREKPFNVFHFIGHGKFKSNKGLIALVEENNQSRLLDDEYFTNLFVGNKNLGLIILNSCEGATTSSHQVFAGIAPHLVRRGIPSVIAMQYPVPDSTAALFAVEFYKSLAMGLPVDAAIQATRNAISKEKGLAALDFGIPVLYTRAKDGIIFKGI